MGLKIRVILLLIFFQLVLLTGEVFAFWVWTPRSGRFVNPKHAVKDTPAEQYEWAMGFFEEGEFEQAAREFKSLVMNYPDSQYAPEAQYYAGRAYEEAGKHYFAFQEYQKTIAHYPYTERLEEIVKRQFHLANAFQTRETPRLMDVELSTAPLRAVEIYEKVIENMPYGEYAVKAYYNKGECYRRMRKYDEAIKAYERIINDYPEHPLVPEARYQLAYTRSEAALDSEYDQRATRAAIEAFQKMVDEELYPEHTGEARQMRDKLLEKEARGQMEVADFYIRQRRYESALIYLRGVVSDFPGTEAAREAREKIGRIEERTES